MKRIISLLLVLALLTGNLAPAAAVEMQETTAPTEETVLETTEVTVPTEKETEPTETTTATEPETTETTAATEPEQVELEETAEAKGATIVDSGTCGENVTWALDSEGTLTISGEGAMESYEYTSAIPWYSSRSSIRVVVIEEGVTSIVDYVFLNYENLININVDAGNASYSSVDGVLFTKDKTILLGYPVGKANAYTIPDGTTKIGAYAFSYDKDLTEVTLPNSVATIGYAAFAECTNLTSITIPDSVTAIEHSAFTYCEKLPSIVIPDSVTSIGDFAFWGCFSLTEVEIPRSVTFIGNRAFWGCSSLTGIHVAEENPSFASDSSGILFNKEKTTLIDCPIGYEGGYVIPDSVTAIDNWAFDFCSGLTEVIIPNTVTAIGDGAFEYCESLTSITIPDNITSIGDSTFSHCTRLSNIVIPDGVARIGDGAFYSCNSLTSVTIPDSVAIIGYNAFAGCESLIRIYFEGSAPTPELWPFDTVTATAYYPKDDPTWTEEVRQGYGGAITWVPYSLEEPDLSIDTDDDGIPDYWEIYGADFDGDGTVDIHLELMGANPNVPDIFVEVDWMQREYKKTNFLWWTVSTQKAINLKPKQETLDMVAEQFANHGYNLHIDAGSDSVDYVTGKKWGTLSGGNPVEYQENLFLGLINGQWNRLVVNNMARNRATIFRHCLFANQYNWSNSSGIANNIPGQYFIVADVDGWLSKAGNTAIASTFMHELGHTLGLSHGGIKPDGNRDHTQYKPNYLSIMNYLFQIQGLYGLDGIDSINYSEYSLPEIDENNIDENKGIDPYGEIDKAGLGTIWYYNGKDRTGTRDVMKTAIDFNNNGNSSERGLSINLNSEEETVLHATTCDWDHIIIQGGAIGDHGAEIDTENMVVVDEELLNEEIELTKQVALEHSLLGDLWDCEIDSVSPGVLYAGVPDQVLSVVIQNLYPADTTPRLFVTSDLLNETCEEYVSVASIKSSTVEIPVAENLEPGTYTVKYELVSESGLYDTLTVNVEVAEVQTVEICAGDSKDLIPDEAVKALNIAWESSDEAVVTIENGIATAISVGKAYVSGRMENGEVLVCLVEVKKSYDVNGDTLVDEADISQIVWHLLFAETFPLTNDADFDCDGDVDLNDAADLLWRVLFPVTQ